MNFVKASQSYNSTDVTHVQDQGFQNRQGLGGGGFQGHYNGPGPWPQNFGGPQNRYNGPQGPLMGPRGGLNRPTGRFGQPSSFNQSPGLGNQNHFNGPRQNLNGPRQRLDTQERFSSPAQKLSPSQYSGFVKPVKAEDHFEGGDGSSQPPPDSSQSSMSRPFSAPTMRHPYSGPRFPASTGTRMTGRFAASGEGGGPMRAGGRGFGRGPRFGGAGRGSSSSSDNFSSVEAAAAAAARATKAATNPNAKCIVLASTNPYLAKFKRLAEEIKRLKSKRPNAIDTIHSAANIAHVSIQSEIESGPIVRGTGTFFCLVQFDGVNISVCTGLNKRSAKVEAFEVALQKLMKPFQRIVEIDGSSKEYQASDYDFAAEEPKQTVIKPTSTVVSDISGDSGDGIANTIQRESNVEALVDIKKKNYVAKELCDFVLVEPQEHNTSVNGASILRRSADFSKMLLEYDFAAFGTGGAVRCVLKVEGHVLADVIAHSKMASKVEASQKAVDALRKQCWTILTKQVHDSNAPEITKDEMFADLASCVSTNASSMSTPIADSNLGKKLLQKMGWTGGGIGKDGAGIEEPVTMKQVINREGLGLDAKRGISGDFRSRITELLENYASSERQDDLVFSPQFRKDERVIIHNECRRLNLKSKSNSQGNTRYLIVRRKRSAYQLLDHVMQCGGETARYKVVPPGERTYPWRPAGISTMTGTIPTTKAEAAGGKPGANGGTTSAASSQTKPPLLSTQSVQGQSGNVGKNQPSGLSGQSQPAGAMGQNSSAGMFAQNSSAGMLGRNGAGGIIGQNSSSVMMGQNSSNGSTGQAGMRGQNSSVGMIGQNSSSGMVRPGSTGLLGPKPSPLMMGQNSAGMMGQNFASGVMGHNPVVEMMAQNLLGLMGQNPARFQR